MNKNIFFIILFTLTDRSLSYNSVNTDHQVSSKRYLSILNTYLLMCAILMSIATPVKAADLFWGCSLDDVTNNTCWTGSTVPAAFDNAYIDNSGTASMSDASPLPLNEFEVLNLYVGQNNTGTFLQNGASNLISDDLYLGFATSSVGDYTQNSGDLSARNEYVGYNGTGSFTQAGDNTANRLYLGYGRSGNGAYNMNSGNLNISQSEYIGYEGAGTFTQNGGIHSVMHDLRLGFLGGGDGEYHLNAGSLTANNQYIGNEGDGRFVQQGGSNNILQDLRIGLGSGGIGNHAYELSSTGSLTIGNILGITAGSFSQTGGTNTVGNNTTGDGLSVGADGLYTLSDGDLTVNGTTFVVGSFIQTGGTHTTTDQLIVKNTSPGIGYEMSGGNLSTDRLDINTNGSFSQAGGTTITNTLNLDGNYVLSGTGDLTVNTANIGVTGSGSFQQTGGSHTVGDLWLKSGNSYTISDGNLNARAIFWQSGDVSQSGGNVTVQQLNMFGGSPSYNLSGGTLEVSGGIIGHGIQGYATFIHSGGNFISNSNLSIENNFSAFDTTTYTLSNNGSLSVAGDLELGLFGSSVFNQTGGSSTVANNLLLGISSISDGTYNLQGGSLTVGNIVRDNGTGVFNFTGGNLELTAGGVLLETNGIFGTSMTLTSGMGLTVSGNIADGVGTSQLNLNGGSLSVGGGMLNVDNLNVDTTPADNVFYQVSSADNWTVNNNAFLGAGGVGHIIQTGGNHNISNDLLMGLTGTGVYEISDGNLSVGNDARVGLFTGGIARISQTGGNVTIGNQLQLASHFAANGTYELRGGTLSVETIVLGSGISPFIFEGGKLSVNNFQGDLFNNGGTLAPGDSPGTTQINGDYTQLIAGIFEVEIGGLIRGSEYDWLDVLGTADLDGILEVSFFDSGSGLFEASEGDVFDILSAETILGEFDLLTLAILGEGLKWDVSYLKDFSGTTDIVRLSVVSAVPIPSAVWLFGSGLLSLIGVARRNKP